LLSGVLLCSGSAGAQLDQAIPEAALREPWDRQLAVLQSLSSSITAAPGDARAQLDGALAMLQVTLGEFELQVDRVIDRMIGDAQFAYVATETSQELSVQLAEIHGRFETLYAALGVQTRSDVRAAQASLDRLREILQAKAPFERDVLQASGFLQLRIELATRWWNGEERAIAVKALVATLRAKLAGVGNVVVRTARGVAHGSDPRNTLIQ
jgi:hypothetical protein